MERLAAARREKEARLCEGGRCCHRPESRPSAAALSCRACLPRLWPVEPCQPCLAGAPPSLHSSASSRLRATEYGHAVTEPGFCRGLPRRFSHVESRTSRIVPARSRSRGGLPRPFLVAARLPFFVSPSTTPTITTSRCAAFFAFHFQPSAPARTARTWRCATRVLEIPSSLPCRPNLDPRASG